MKPEFALILSHDGIALVQRAKEGWTLLGDASLEADDPGADITALRDKARAIAPRGFRTKLVLPDSQILYTAIYAPGPSNVQRRKQIEAALEGMTPYAVPDLVYDFAGGGQTVQVAVIARETLGEAESFAEEYGFCPVSFVAAPEPADFPAEPHFGLTSTVARHIPEGARIDPDSKPIFILPVEPETAVEAEPVAEASVTESDETVPLEATVSDEVDDSASPAPESPADPAQTEEPAEDETPDDAAEDTLPEDVPVEDITAEDLADLEALDLPAEDIPEDALPEEADSLETLLDAGTDQGAEETPEVADAPPEETETNAAPEADKAAPAPETASETPEPEETTDASTIAAAFASRRDPSATQDETSGAPRLGGAGRLSPPQPDRKKIATGEAGIAAPALDIPGAAMAPVAATANPAPTPGKLDAPKPDTAKPKALAPEAAEAPMISDAEPLAGESAEDRTVFGGLKRVETRGKPRYLGAMLTGALVIVLALVGLWAVMLDEPVGPEDTTQIAPEPELAPETQVASAAAPTDNQPAAAPEPEPVPEPEPQAAAPAPEAAPEPAPEAAPASPPAEMPALPDVTLAAPQPTAEPEAPASDAPAETSATVSTANPTELPPFTAQPLPPPEVVPAPAPVEPTEEGVEMPGGFTLYAGKPEIVPQARPDAVREAYAATLPATPEQTFNALPALAGFRPAARPEALSGTAPPAATEATPAPSPDDQGALDPALQPNPELRETRPTARPEGVTRLAATQAPTAEPAAAANPELAAARPDQRPASIQEAVQAAMAAQDAAAARNSDPFDGATSLAVAQSERPPEKPSGFSRSVEKALAAAIAAEPAPTRTVAPAPAPPASTADIDEPEPTAPAPKLPTSASVAKQATEKNAINLRKINLIGLYGSSSNRRALVRLANGRFIKVGIGDRLDGGRVTAIGSGQLTYKKGSRSYTLKLLEGS